MKLPMRRLELFVIMSIKNYSYDLASNSEATSSNTYTVTKSRRFQGALSDMEGHSSNCKEYCCSAFANLRDDHPLTHYQPDLNNPIHPLFSREKLHLSVEGYAALNLTLRLASRMLEDDRTVEYVVVTTDGTIHRDHSVDCAPGPECTWAEIDESDLADLAYARLLRYPRASSDTSTTARAWVTDSMRQRSKEILLNLTEILAGYDWAEQRCEGKTETNPDDPVSPAALLNFPRAGGKAVITFSTLSTLDFMKYEKQDNLTWLAEQYILARNFVHEIAHLLSQAVNGQRREEVFYKNSVLSEAGFDLENAIFGGIDTWLDLGQFTGHPTKLASRAIIQEAYPGGRFGRKYSAEGGNTDQRAPLDEYSVVRRIPWRFITAMFTNSFWEVDVPRMGSGPIQPGKKHSWVVKQVMTGESYVNTEGKRVIAERDVIATCSPSDDSLPARVQDVLRSITSGTA